MQELERLKQLIDSYDEAYYNQEQSLVSDEEYDAIKHRYLELTGQEEYDYVPGAIENGTKVKHSYHVSSLAKVKIVEQDKLRAELERLWPVCIQPKLDGCTLVDYPDDSLITRGNGEFGESKTHLRKYIKGLGKSLAHPVRMEALMFKSDFERINKALEDEGKDLLKNARNGLSGMLNRKDAEPDGVTVIAYHVNSGAPVQEQLDELKANGWRVVDTYIPETIDDAMEYINSFDRDALEYDIDGLVVKHLGDKDFGETGHHPKNAVAVKFVAEEKWTELKQVVWQVGRTGKVVPVAEFETIDLMGSDVSRATLHNEAYINALGLHEIRCDKYHSTYVKITKANDIIPAVIEVKHETLEGAPSGGYYSKHILTPTICPDCEMPLEKVNDQIYCRNEHCKERLIAQATHLVSRNALDIRGLSEETIRKMYDLYRPFDYTFPLQYTKDMLLELEGFADKSATKLAKELETKCKEVPMSRFLIAAGIPLLGKTASKQIAKIFKDVNELAEDLDNGGPKMLAINGIGKEIVTSIEAHRDRLASLYDTIGVITSEYEEPKEKRADQKTFVITGTLEKPRKYYQDLIESAGHKCSGSVSKKTFAVLVGEDAGSKETKARELGITMITTEEELKSLF